jgi:probable phosphoglycerate mutase
MKDERGDLSTSVAKKIMSEHGHNLAVVSSSFRRARQTARPLAKALNVRVHVQAGVHERDLGELKHKDASTWQDHPGYMRGNSVNPDFKPKGGESLQDVQSRAVTGLHAAMKKNPGKDLVVFTHGHTARALEAHFKGTWKGGRNWENGEHRAFDYDPSKKGSRADSMIQGRLS